MAQYYYRVDKNDERFCVACGTVKTGTCPLTAAQCTANNKQIASIHYSCDTARAACVLNYEGPYDSTQKSACDSECKTLSPKYVCTPVTPASNPSRSTCEICTGPNCEWGSPGVLSQQDCFTNANNSCPNLYFTCKPNTKTAKLECVPSNSAYDKSALFAYKHDAAGTAVPLAGSTTLMQSPLCEATCHVAERYRVPDAVCPQRQAACSALGVLVNLYTNQAQAPRSSIPFLDVFEDLGALITSSEPVMQQLFVKNSDPAEACYVSSSSTADAFSFYNYEYYMHGTVAMSLLQLGGDKVFPFYDATKTCKISYVYPDMQTAVDVGEDPGNCQILTWYVRDVLTWASKPAALFEEGLQSRGPPIGLQWPDIESACPWWKANYGYENGLVTDLCKTGTYPRLVNAGQLKCTEKTDSWFSGCEQATRPFLQGTCARSDPMCLSNSGTKAYLCRDGVDAAPASPWIKYYSFVALKAPSKLRIRSVSTNMIEAPLAVAGLTESAANAFFVSNLPSTTTVTARYANLTHSIRIDPIFQASRDNLNASMWTQLQSLSLIYDPTQWYQWKPYIDFLLQLGSHIITQVDLGNDTTQADMVNVQPASQAVYDTTCRALTQECNAATPCVRLCDVASGIGPNKTIIRDTREVTGAPLSLRNYVADAGGGRTSNAISNTSPLDVASTFEAPIRYYYTPIWDFLFKFGGEMGQRGVNFQAAAILLQMRKLYPTLTPTVQPVTWNGGTNQVTAGLAFNPRKADYKICADASHCETTTMYKS